MKIVSSSFMLLVIALSVVMASNVFTVYATEIMITPKISLGVEYTDISMTDIPELRLSKLHTISKPNGADTERSVHTYERPVTRYYEYNSVDMRTKLYPDIRQYEIDRLKTQTTSYNDRENERPMSIWESVPEIFEVEFPDTNFRREVLRMLNEDGKHRTDGSMINDTDRILLAAVEFLDVSSMGIRDMTGLEYFSSLIELKCYNN